MALPKRKHGKARRDKSRTHWKLAVRSATACPQCARPIVPHRVCPSCGYYRGRQVLVIAEKKKGNAASS